MSNSPEQKNAHIHTHNGDSEHSRCGFSPRTTQFDFQIIPRFQPIEFLKPFEIKKGITFITSKGEVKIFKTALDLSPIEFIKDVRGCDLNNIDLVISDYEPITAWIAKFKNKTSMGIAHQYAFKYNIPIFGDNFFTRFIPTPGTAKRSFSSAAITDLVVLKPAS